MNLDRKSVVLCAAAWMSGPAFGCRPAVEHAEPPDDRVPTTSATDPAPAERPIERSAMPRVVDAPEPTATFPNPERRTDLLSSTPELSRQIERFMAADHIPGLAVGLVIDDELAWSQGFGVTDLDTQAAVTPSTLFRIGSITKTFTMTAIVGLRDQGKLSLEDAAAEHSPALAAIGYPTDEVRGFTIRDVLLHESGLPRMGGFDFESPEHVVDRAEIEASLQQLTLAQPPGLSRSYSNLGFALLGIVIEDITGEDYRSYVDRTILGPLGMNASTWAVDPSDARVATPHALEHGKVTPIAQENHGAASAAGGLYSTAEDMARYIRLQLAAWPPRSGADEGPLARASIRESHRLQGRPNASTLFPTEGHPQTIVGGTGLSWGVEHGCTFGHLVAHNGRNTGYAAAVMFLPQHGVGLVLLSNQRATNLAELGRTLLETLAENPALTTRLPPVDPTLEARALALFEATQEAEALAPLLSPADRDAEAHAALAQRRQTLGDRLGACSTPAEVSVVGDAVTVRGQCERGRLRIEARTTPEGFGNVHLLEERAHPTPAIKRAAKNVERLLGQWDETLAAKTFAQHGRPSRYRGFFRRINDGWGACRIGDMRLATDQRTEFQLHCTHRSGLIALLDNDGPDDGIAGLWIRDDPEDPRRCTPPQ